MPNNTGTPLARTIIERLVETFGAAADPAQAGPMRAYMRDQFPFLGIKSPAQRTLAREIVAGLGKPTEADLHLIARECWRLAEREYQHFGCALLRRHAATLTPGSIGLVGELIVTRSWWDTVDALASNVVGPMVRQHPELLATMDAWSMDENLWLARTAILHQLRYREATDVDRLLRYCGRQARHPDFFMRKAIGWALREYAKTDPDVVRSFVRANSSVLSGLSQREALRHLSP